jgi:hypothetical protein
LFAQFLHFQSTDGGWARLDVRQEEEEEETVPPPRENPNLHLLAVPTITPEISDTRSDDID